MVVGYTGGQKANPTYANIMDATEAFLVEFDPAVVSYEEILDEWAAQHAPSHPASSRQYRSAIFYRDDAQRDAATKKLVAMSRGGERKVCVDLEPASAFYRGEEYHQDFLDKQTGARAPAF